MRSITIRIHGPNNFDVVEGYLEASRLTWEELLGQVAELTHPRLGVPRFTMMSPDEREEQRRRWAVTDQPEDAA